MADDLNLARRTFLAGAAAAAALAETNLASAKPAHPIPDHRHPCASVRPAPAARRALYRPAGSAAPLALPQIYHKLAAPTGIVGAITIEASPWIEDNLWILERAESDPLFVGVVGNLQPDKPEFPEYLGRFSKNPLWRGIRYSTVWKMDGDKQVLKPGMVDGLKLLAQADQVLDMANPNIALLGAALLVADAVPDLRIVMDHMPQFDPTPQTQARYDELIGELKQRPNFFVKLSSVIHKDLTGKIDPSLAAHRGRLDELIGAFGIDRVMFGSNWPQSVGTATIPQAVSLMREYFADKPREDAEKYFWRNSARIYKWIKRKPNQPAA